MSPRPSIEKGLATSPVGKMSCQVHNQNVRNAYDDIMSLITTTLKEARNMDDFLLILTLTDLLQDVLQAQNTSICTQQSEV